MPSCRRAAHGVPHGDAALRVEACAGLVEEEDLGPVRDGAGDLDALGEAAGELGGVGAGALGKLELGEELLGSLARVGAGEAEIEAMEADVFKDGAGAVEGVVLRDDADVTTGDRRRGDDIDTGNADAAGGGESAGGADADGGGLAGAVRAEQAEELALPHGEVDAVDGDHALFSFVDLVQRLDLDDHERGSPGEVRLHRL